MTPSNHSFNILPMFVYDSTSIAFARRAEKYLRKFIQARGFQVARSRFLVDSHWYPLRVVVFDGKELGHFDKNYLQIALNRKLAWSAKDAVTNQILQHEFAHYMTYIKFKDVPAHGSHFYEVCRQLGLSSEVARAAVDLDLANESVQGDLASEAVLVRIKKLLQLAGSDNKHEAELATLKANQILLRHNLSQSDLLEDEPIFMNRVLARPRKDAKLSAIYEILAHFVVRTVISHGTSSCCLEISGGKTNVLLGSYVADFLDRELEQLWIRAKQAHNLKGLVAKNSFFDGVAKGFTEKQRKARNTLPENDLKALAVLESDLMLKTRVVYPRLSHSRSTRRDDEQASKLGLRAGHDLSIRQGVTTGQTGRLLKSSAQV